MVKRFICIILLLAIPALTLADELIIEPEMGRAPLLKSIANAKQSIHLIMYGFTDKTLLDAILKQKAQGRSVRVILEETPYKAINENKSVINIFKKANVAWQGKIPSFQLIHQKTLITDTRQAIVMTFNFTRSAFKNDRNFGLMIDDPKKVNEIEKVFSADWNHVPVSEHSPDLIYSPSDSRVKLLTLIQNTKKSLKIYAQSVSDYQITGALAALARKGVSVSILTSNKLHPKAEAYLSRAGVKIYLSTNYYIHAKAFIFDDNTAVIGSINLTRPSLDSNRELSVVTRDSSVVQQLSEQFSKDIKDAS